MSDNIKRRIYKDFQMNKFEKESVFPVASEERRPILFSTETSFSPPTDVWETDDDIFIIMEIAGLKSSEFNIQYSEGYLIVEGERQPSEELIKAPIVKFHKVRIKMNNRIKDSGINAKYFDGLLLIILKKDTQGRKIESISIPVKM
jgi:HSP20 family molecular chaperone IbpA